MRLAWSIVCLAVLPACPALKEAHAPDAAPPIDTSDRDPTGGRFTLEEATAGLEGSGKLVAKIETGEGSIVVELYGDKTPKTVATFVGLARGTRIHRDPTTNAWVKKPFYDGLTFHRVIPEFMIQGGDPLGDGTGGPGFKIEDERDPDLAFDKPGLIAIANARAPNTGGSQFFITEVPAPNLDGSYTIFGEVIEGLDLVKKIARVDATDTRPNHPVVIKKIAIERR
jgi:peptidyl-prolyl cis-trans isomerase A (cyclophilin A)